MRGQQVIFNEIFTEAPVLSVSRRGRSEDLIDKRNAALIDRYFFYGFYEKLRYDVILEKLSNEFFIAPFTIQERITDCYEQLDELRLKKPSKDYFKKKYPHLVW